MIKKSKIIDHPALLLAFWFAYLLATFSGIIRYKYILDDSGVKLLRILFTGIWKSSILFLIAFLIVLAYWIWKYLRKQVKNKSKFSFNLIGISSMPMFVFTSYLLKLNDMNYPNYLYTRFGLTVSGMSLVSNISFDLSILYILFLLSENHKFLGLVLRENRKLADILLKESGLILPFRSNKKALSLLVFLVLLAHAFSPFTMFSSYLSLTRLPYSRFFSHFEYVQELKRVPENAMIILPPQGVKWPAIGNLPVSRYFLFPRELVSSAYLTDQERAQELGDLYFAYLPNSAIDDSFWPDINETGKEIAFSEESMLNYLTLNVFYEDSQVTIYHIIF